MKKRFISTLCGCSAILSCYSLAWSIPTYTNDFGNGTCEYNFNDFLISIPESWDYLEAYSSDDWKAFSIMNNGQEYGIAALVYGYETYESNNFSYSAEDLAAIDGDEEHVFSTYPILNDTERCYFSTYDHEDDNVYTFAFPYNGLDYVVMFQISSDSPFDFSLDIANIIASVKYADSKSDSSEDNLESKYNELLKKYNELLGIKNPSIDSTTNANDNPELPEGDILFRNIPWKTSFATVQTLVPEFNLWALSGESFKTYSVDDIIYGDYEGINFQESGFNVIGNAYNKEQEVAGYTTSDISMYFVYPVIDGNIDYTDANSLLYGARYEFEPKDVDLMLSDLKEKLSALYGDPVQDCDVQSFVYESEHIVVWETKTCKLSIHSYKDSSYNTLDVNYALKEADVLLQQNNDIIYNQKVIQQSEQYGNGNTNGL